MAYCQPTDVDLGSIPWPRQITATIAAENAASEIDAKIGSVYTLPLTSVAAGSRDQKLLSHINKFLAVGRVLLLAAGPGENTSLHSYGFYMVREAGKLIDQIVSGEIKLESEAYIPDDQKGRTTGPVVTNVDSASYVDSFYNATGTAYPHGDRFDEGWVQGVPRTW